jgi:hypothetical protein
MMEKASAQTFVPAKYSAAAQLHREKDIVRTSENLNKVIEEALALGLVGVAEATSAYASSWHPNCRPSPSTNSRSNKS